METVLLRIGFFKAEDFDVLAKMVLKLTLPAAIVVSFAGRQITLDSDWHQLHHGPPGPDAVSCKKKGRFL